MTLLSVMGLLAALEAGTGAAVTVRSDSDCPSAESVRAALQALGGRQPPRPASASVRSRGDELTIAFSWPTSAASEERTLAVTADCESRAQSAAVVIASWLGILPDVASSMARPSVTPPAAMPVPPAEPTVSASAAVPVDARAARPPGAEADLAAERSGPYWLGFGLVGAAGGGIVPGLRIELLRAYQRRGFGFGWLASAFATMPRSTFLAGGTSRWVRPALGLSGFVSRGGPRLRLALDAGPVAALTVAWGSGYADNHASYSPTWGAAAGLRLQRAWASSAVWADLRVIAWLRAQSLQHDIQPVGILGSAALPSFEAMLSLGWSFAL